MGNKPLVLGALAVAIEVAAVVAILVSVADDVDISLARGVTILFLSLVVAPLAAIWLGVAAWQLANRPAGGWGVGLVIAAAVIPVVVTLLAVVYEPAGPPSGVIIGDVTGP